MDWIQVLDVIKARLEAYGYTDTVNKLIDAQLILGTPGEMYMEVMNELVELKHAFPDQYGLIKNEIQSLLDYGKSIGYYKES